MLRRSAVEQGSTHKRQSSKANHECSAFRAGETWFEYFAMED